MGVIRPCLSWWVLFAPVNEAWQNKQETNRLSRWTIYGYWTCCTLPVTANRFLPLSPAISVHFRAKYLWRGSNEWQLHSMSYIDRLVGSEISESWRSQLLTPISKLTRVPEWAGRFLSMLCFCMWVSVRLEGMDGCAVGHPADGGMPPNVYS